MAQHVSGRRRVAGGLACITAGATALAWAAAGPAAAHGKQEPEKPPVQGDHTCLELAEAYGIDQSWTQYSVDVPEDDFDETFVIDDRGTGDEADDATVTVSVEGGDLLEWSATIGIDAVLVKGSNDAKGSYFYIYAASADDEEAFDDYHLGVPPWNNASVNKIVGVQFCFDDEHAPPTTDAPPVTEAPPAIDTPPSTEAPPPTEAPPDTATPSTAPPTTEAPATTPPTAPPPTRPVADDQLPRTGSSTAPLVAGGGALLAVGIALVAGRRFVQRRQGLTE